MKLHLALAGVATLSLFTLLPAEAGATGVCDATAASPQACIDAVQNSGGVVNDIFTDANGLTGEQLPVFGKLYNVWQGCPQEVPGGCAGTSTPPYDCPGLYSCASPPPTFANASGYLNALDHLWWQPCRLANPNLVNINGMLCPQWACIADGVGGAYFPWEGLVFDLGGPSNKVAIFAQNDHGPQPCESFEYTVYLTDDPHATDLIQDPSTQGVNPGKWNRAVLSKIYTQGWKVFRNPPVMNPACGDTAQYFVEDDSFVQVFSLPCGITFRYASIIAGNDGLDFPECAFDSQEAELDAVAGLTESGAAVCPDADMDHFVDCACPGAPPVCDCVDSDPAIHPGAPEPCNTPDANCDGLPGMCPANLVCYEQVCIPTCAGGENPFCPAGSTCTPTAEGNLCVPDDCTQVGCPPGGVCKNGICVPACDRVVCPGNQICQDGSCIDPCAGIQCPAGQLCQAGVCVSPCNCFAGDLGCLPFPNTICDKGATDLCVPPLCANNMCAADQTCDPLTGQCLDFCNPNVKCPEGQKCVAPLGCIPLCEDVVCPPGLVCDPKTGMCQDQSCDGITCFDPQVCIMGVCVTPEGGVGDGGVDAGEGGMGGAPGTGGHSGGKGGADPGETGGCGCRVAGDDDPLGRGGALALLGLAAIVSARSARARGRSRSRR